MEELEGVSKVWLARPLENVYCEASGPRNLNSRDTAPKYALQLDAPITPPTSQRDITTASFLRANGFLLGLAALKLLLHLPLLHRYGYHNDELYFLACGRHFSFGYVDHPPFVPWMARVATDLFGASLFGLRIIPALAGCSAVFLIGLLVRRIVHELTGDLHA